MIPTATGVARSDEGIFSWDRIGGFVDSWPKTLVPSASNRSTPEWTPVDSSGLPPRAKRSRRQAADDGLRQRAQLGIGPGNVARNSVRVAKANAHNRCPV